MKSESQKSKMYALVTRHYRKGKTRYSQVAINDRRGLSNLLKKRFPKAWMLSWKIFTLEEHPDKVVEPGVTVERLEQLFNMTSSAEI